MDLYDISTNPPRRVGPVGAGFRGSDGRRHPAQAAERWSEAEWRAEAGTLRPFRRVVVEAVVDDPITEFDLSVWPHVVREIVPTPAPAPRPVARLLILDRLVAADLWQAAKAALAADELANDRWNAATEIYDTDPQVRALLTAIGADPDAILAPEGS